MYIADNHGIIMCLEVMRADLKPDGITKLLSFKALKIFLVSPTTRLKIWFRLGAYMRGKKQWILIYFLIKLFFRHLQYKTGIQIRMDTQIGEGLHFIHFGNIVINASAKIGRNCTIFNGVTLGASFLGGLGPKVGDNVCLCTGAKVIGDVKIGNNVIIGAGAVVVKDIPDNAIVVGVPAKVISMDGDRKALMWRHQY